MPIGGENLDFSGGDGVLRSIDIVVIRRGFVCSSSVQSKSLGYSSASQ